MIQFTVYILALNNLVSVQIDTKSYIKQGSHTHRDVFNSNTSTAVWVTIPPETKVFSSLVTEDIQVGPAPTNLTWSPEFSPVGSWEDEITYPATAQTILLSPSQGVKYTTTYNFWAKHMGGSVYAPPAWQHQYESDGSGGYNYKILRESSIYRNFESGFSFYMPTPR